MNQLVKNPALPDRAFKNQDVFTYALLWTAIHPRSEESGILGRFRKDLNQLSRRSGALHSHLQIRRSQHGAVKMSVMRHGA